MAKQTKAINRDDLLNLVFPGDPGKLDKILSSPPAAENRTFGAKRRNSHKGGPIANKHFIWTNYDNQREAVLTGVSGLIPLNLLILA